MDKPSVMDRFEIHYIFEPNDTSHTMDALVLHRCDDSFLNIVHEIITRLNFDITVEAEALSEGGIRQFLKFCGTSSEVKGLLAILTIIATCSAGVLAVVNMLLPNELEDLQKKKLQLENAILKNKLANGETSAANTIAQQLLHDPVINRFRSKFYQELVNYSKVQGVGYSTQNSYREITTTEKVVSRQEFSQFIVNTEEIEDYRDEEAEILLISPNVQNGERHWFGRYQDQDFSFVMKDKAFRESVASGSQPVVNVTIKCILTAKQDLNAEGDITQKAWTVREVIGTIVKQEIQLTQTGKKHAHSQKQRDGQEDLFK